MTKSKIRSVVRLNESIIRWEFIDDCLPGKERPTDVDGMIEKKGNFLMLEHKNPGARISVGQGIMYRRFSELPNCKVLVFFSRMKDNLPQNVVRMVVFEEGCKSEIKNPSMDTFKEYIRNWRSGVDGKNMAQTS